MEIGSGNGYPASALSNFAPHPFMFDGVQCNSFEGFLQSLKFESVDMQKHVCTLVGKGAKNAGGKKKWFRKQELFWNGKTYKRDSDDYQLLLNKAYNEMYKQNEGFKNALISSKNSVFTHTIGKKDISKTVLTTREFCGRLTYLRDYGLLNVKK